VDHGDILKTAAKTIAKRRESYGSPAECFERAAAIASAVLDRAVTPYEIAVIFNAMKLARIAQSPANPDHYIDAVAYMSFAAEFVGAEPEHPRDSKASTPAVSGQPDGPLREGTTGAGAPAARPPADRAAP
jgi:Domain of unknown function (DUF6378)